MRCTPEEIKKKHQLAREKLMAKRLLPFTSSQKTVASTQSTQIPQPVVVPKQIQVPQPNVVPKQIQPIVPKSQEIVPTKKFQPRIPMVSTNTQNKPMEISQKQTSSMDIKSIIEKKRQEALMKLRRRQIPSKMI